MSGQAGEKGKKDATRVVAVNGSPRLDTGNTGLLLGAFLRGAEKAGADVELVHATRAKIRPCNCGSMDCWFKHPGECCHKDDMLEILPRVGSADVLVLAIPVYVPLPGDMQNLINRLSPLMEPEVTLRDGRSRARYRDWVSIKRVVAVATGSWWEIENFDTVLRIVREVAENASVEFAGALLRPHADQMWREGELTLDGQAVLAAAERGGRELIEQGRVQESTLEAVRRPLASEPEVRRWFNGLTEHLR
jgi:multimeric flavodoxin WrbA